MTQLELQGVPTTYPELLALIRKEIPQGMSQIRRFVDYQKIVTNWRVGKHISDHLLQHRDKSDYGEKLYDRLAGDLQISKRFLQTTVQFYRTYSLLPKEDRITWSHYRTLLTVKDQDRREDLERKINEQNLGISHFEEVVRAAKKNERRAVSLPVRAMECRRGQLYIYRLVKAGYVHRGGSEILVDCGFENYIERPAEDRNKFASGTLVEGIRTSHGFRLRRTRAPKEHLYTFAARVERVMDGDSVAAYVDCGFGIWTRQTLRLRGLDAPELTSPGGRLAKRHVEEALAGVDFVVIKTCSGAQDGRYLADIFYLPGSKDRFVVAEQGRYLNQELLDRHLAVPVPW